MGSHALQYLFVIAWLAHISYCVKIISAQVKLCFFTPANNNIYKTGPKYYAITLIVQFILLIFLLPIYNPKGVFVVLLLVNALFILMLSLIIIGTLHALKKRLVLEPEKMVIESSKREPKTISYVDIIRINKNYGNIFLNVANSCDDPFDIVDIGVFHNCDQILQHIIAQNKHLEQYRRLIGVQSGFIKNGLSIIYLLCCAGLCQFGLYHHYKEIARLF